MFKKPMASSVDPDQTAPILNSSVYVRQLFAADHFIRRYFQMHFFLGALKVKKLAFRIATNPVFLHTLNMTEILEACGERRALYS